MNNILGSTYNWSVAADDSLDFDFTGQSTGSDVAITANIGDNLVFNVNASYTTGGGGGGSTPQTFNLVVTASGFSDYTVSGSDRTGNINGADPTVEFNEGDTINFTVSAAGHPFYLKTGPVNGTASKFLLVLLIKVPNLALYPGLLVLVMLVLTTMFVNIIVV